MSDMTSKHDLNVSHSNKKISSILGRIRDRKNKFIKKFFFI